MLKNCRRTSSDTHLLNALYLFLRQSPAKSLHILQRSLRVPHLNEGNNSFIYRIVQSPGRIATCVWAVQIANIYPSNDPLWAMKSPGNRYFAVMLPIFNMMEIYRYENCRTTRDKMPLWALTHNAFLYPYVGLWWHYASFAIMIILSPEVLSYLGIPTYVTYWYISIAHEPRRMEFT